MTQVGPSTPGRGSAGAQAPVGSGKALTPRPHHFLSLLLVFGASADQIVPRRARVPVPGHASREAGCAQARLRVCFPPCALIARSPTGCRGLLSGSLRPHPRREGLGDAGKRLLRCPRQQEVRSLGTVPACGCERVLGCVCTDVCVHVCPCITCMCVYVHVMCVYIHACLGTRLGCCECVQGCAHTGV